MASHSNKYCPCCGYDTFGEDKRGQWKLCPICYWEDDPIQLQDHHYSGGANSVSVAEARENYAKFGACEEHLVKYTSLPKTIDKRKPDWKVIQS